MDYRKSRLILDVFGAGALLFGLFGILTEILWVEIVCIVLFVLGMGQTVFFYKCPYCGSHFNFRERTPKFCPNCGKELD